MSLPSLADLEAAAALVYQEMLPTPQLRWPLLCQRTGADVWLKHENHAPTGAFKVRGGIVYLHELLLREPQLKGVIAATRGNHGQSVAFSAARRGLRCVIVVPHGNSPEKNAAMSALGAELIEHGNDFQDAMEHAARLAQADGLHYIPAFAEPLVRGVATYSLELFRAVPNIDTLYVPIGLGSGICGAIAARDALGLKTQIVGVNAEAAPGYSLSFHSRRAVSATVQPTIADGIACRVPNAQALDIILRGASRVVTVTEREIRSAMRSLFTDTHNLAEGSAASAFAALLKERNSLQGRRVAVILSGANVDRPVFARVLSESEQ